MPSEGFGSSNQQRYAACTRHRYFLSGEDGTSSASSIFPLLIIGAYIYILCILLHSRDSLCPHTVIYMFLVAAQPYGLNVIILSFRITGCISTLPFRKAAAIAGTSSPSASLFRSSLVLTLLTVIISTAAMCGSKAMNSRGQYMTTLA